AHIPWTPVLTGLMPGIQIVILLIGLLFSLDYGYKLSIRTYGDESEGRRGWMPMACFLIGLTLFFIWLFVG
ncbi:MAG: hypothetical protein AB1798_11500, partial [Spirochaetota bacterium]